MPLVRDEEVAEYVEQLCEGDEDTRREAASALKMKNATPTNRPASAHPLAETRNVRASVFMFKEFWTFSKLEFALSAHYGRNQSISLERTLISPQWPFALRQRLAA